ncbi:MAG: dephospho-CoA kinase [Pirellulales bacterium]
MNLFQPNPDHHHVHIIGIIGGIASGKSLATEYFRQLGAAVLDADGVAHEVLSEPDVVAALRERWGDEILDDAGQIERTALAEIVFGSSNSSREELKYLEKLVHARIGDRLRQELVGFDESRVVVLDAAVMVKTGWDKFCNQILFVDAGRELRLHRARQRGWDENEFSRRESAQESLEKKRSLADFVLENNGTLPHLQRQISDFWDSHLDLDMRN